MSKLPAFLMGKKDDKKAKGKKAPSFGKKAKK